MFEQLKNNASKAGVGVMLSVGALGVGAGAQAAEDCPMYPPGPCNTIPPEETIPTTTVPEITTTTVPEISLPETGNNTQPTLWIAGVALLTGAGITVASHRRNANS